MNYEKQSNIFEASSLTVGYNNIPLIKNIELNLKRGRILVLIGPNGAGKSTILKTITKYMGSLSGTIYIDGEDLKGLNNNELAKRLSVVLTERMKTERMSCEEVVETARYPHTGRLGVLSQRDREKVYGAMEVTNVLEIKDRDFTRISDGQKQRVLLARAIAQEPKIIVLDEPTTFLDIKYQLELLNILKEMAKKSDIAIVLSLHELQLAQRIADDVLCVKGDKIEYYGDVEGAFKKDRIHNLYDLKEGNYNEYFGSLEMKKICEEEPSVFVVGGNGTAIPVYRYLQKSNRAFYTGVIHENDVDFFVGKDLAEEIISQSSFDEISEENYIRAEKLLAKTDVLVYAVKNIGQINRKNQELLTYAENHNIKIYKSLEELKMADSGVKDIELK